MMLASSSASVRDIVRKIEKRTVSRHRKQHQQLKPEYVKRDDDSISDISTDESEDLSHDSRFQYNVEVKTLKEQIEERIRRSRQQSTGILPTNYLKTFSKIESMPNVYAKSNNSVFEGSPSIQADHDELRKIVSSPAVMGMNKREKDNQTIVSQCGNMTAVPETMTQIFQPDSVFGDESPYYITEVSPNNSDYTSKADEDEFEDEKSKRSKKHDDEVSEITMNEKQFHSSPSKSQKSSELKSAHSFPPSSASIQSSKASAETLGTAVIQLLQNAIAGSPNRSKNTNLPTITEEFNDEDEEDYEKLKSFLREIGCTQSKANHYAKLLIQDGVGGIDILTRRLQRDGAYLLQIGFDVHFAQDILELLVPDSPLLPHQQQQHISENMEGNYQGERYVPPSDNSVIDLSQPSPNLSHTFSLLSQTPTIKSKNSLHSMVSNTSSFFLSNSVYEDMLAHPKGNQQAYGASLEDITVTSGSSPKKAFPAMNYKIEVLPSETSSIYYQAVQLRNEEATEKLIDLAEAGDIFAQGFVMRMHALGQAYFPKDLLKATEIAQRIFNTLQEIVTSRYEDHANFAAYMIGVCYSEGLFVKKNPKEAIKWYKASAKKGYEAAQAYVGFCLYTGLGIVKNPIEAVKWYTLSASQGFAPAQTNLGICYEYGDGVEKDIKTAIHWYTLAAEQNDATALFNLGHCYEYGIGVPRSLLKASEYYTQASEFNHAASQYTLACLYSTGSDELPKDLVEAAKLYKRAADQGYAEAQCKLGLLYENGLGVNKDMQQAVKYYRLAANQSNAAALYYLGYCYFNGLGLPQDHSIAVKLYYKSASKGYAAAQNNLGFCYFIGAGISQSHVDAVKWYQKAAEQGYAAAQYNLGYCYEKGYGVTHRLNDMIKWYGLAAKQGHEKANKKIQEKLSTQNITPATVTSPSKVKSF